MIVFNSPAGIIVFLVIVLSMLAVCILSILLVRSRNKEEKR